ncbi:hypothetical protein AMK10_23845 [Streptomyces sp. CB02058]|nr:hypothetical protein AMK10_23845 [Streptomyces sp. CB02058]
MGSGSCGRLLDCFQLGLGPVLLPVGDPLVLVVPEVIAPDLLPLLLGSDQRGFEDSRAGALAMSTSIVRVRGA